MKLIRLCWSEAARRKKGVRENATHWYKCTTQAARDFQANCEVGNRDYGADSHWVELWDVVEGRDGDPLNSSGMRMHGHLDPPGDSDTP
jgi:hypothetical protein